MMAIRLDANERSLADLFYVEAPRLKWNRKTLTTVALVGAAYGILGGYFALQKIQFKPIEQPGDDPVITMNPWPRILHQRTPDKTTPPPQPRNLVISRPTDPVFTDPVVDPIFSPPVTGDPPQTSTGPAVLPTTSTPPATMVPTQPTPPPVNRTIRNPDWLTIPTQAQTNAIYPQRASRMGLSGQADLVCSVLASGAMSGCEIASETPKANGFGVAALRLAPHFRMNPRTVDGQTIEGAKVRIPVEFNYSG